MSADAKTVVVIGSGPCGAMAAHQLLRDGVPVTMLEAGSGDPAGFLVRAGGRTLLRKTPVLENEENYQATGNEGTLWYRTLAPGGLSNQWTGAVPRFAPEDFSDGERIDERYRWPIDYTDLEPYYQRAERIIGVSGSRRDVAQLPAGLVERVATLPRGWNGVAEVAVRHGQGLVPMPLADGRDWLVAPRATAFNSYSIIVRRLRDDPRFELKTGCTALQLMRSKRRGQVDSVLYHDQTLNADVRLPAAAVVVACGPIGSTKLLFDSACGDFPDGLGNSEGVLGRYLHDHPKEWWTVQTERPITRPGHALYLTRRPFVDAPPLTSTSWTIGLSCTKEKIRSLLPGRTTTLGVQVFGSMTPSEQWYVRPHPSLKDRFGLAQLEVHIEFEPDVLANVHRARQDFIDLMGEAGYPTRLDAVVPQCQPGLAVHFGGTIRMHASPRFGVTNEWGRLFEVSNVAVADASTFTTGSEKNPTLTAMALAARTAERLAHDLKRG